MSGDEDTGEPAGVTALLGGAAEAAEGVLQIGARVREKFLRDAATRVRTPEDVERLGREWAEIFDDTARVGKRMFARFTRR